MLKNKKLQFVSVLNYILCVLCAFVLLIGSNLITITAETVSNTAQISGINIDSDETNNSATVNDVICPNLDVARVSLIRINASNSQVTNGTVTMQYIVTNNGIDNIEQIIVQTAYFKNLVGLPTVTSSSGVIDNNFLIGGQIGGAGTPSLIDDRYFSKIKITGLNLLPSQNYVMDITFNATNSILETESTPFANALITADAVAEIPDSSPIPGCVSQDSYNDNAYALGFIQHLLDTDLSIIKTSSGGGNSDTSSVGRLDAGSNASYTISIFNDGSKTAIGPVTVTDTFPDKITPIDQGGGNYTSSPNWTCTFSAPTMTCTNPNSIAPSGSSSIVIDGVVNQT